MRGFGGWVLVVAMLVPVAEAQQWVDLTPSGGPAPARRAYGASIYDPLGHRVIVFGGQTISGDDNDVWAFDLATGTWTELSPITGSAPAPRFTPNAVYDPLGHRMVVWAGQGGSTFFNDVWAFDLTSQTWSEFQPAPPEPNVRYGTAAVFDPLGRDLVTFGGFTDQGRFDDTWRFDVDEIGWTDATPGTGSPGRRCLHSASLDLRNRRMIMYGGQRSGPLGDIWAFDLNDDTWQELTPADSPAGRYLPAHVYDAARHRALIFGGNPEPAPSDEVWAFDLAAERWDAVAPQGTKPEARDGATAVYVVTEDRMLAFGGYAGAAGLQNDVWALELSPPGQSVPFPDALAAEQDGFVWTIPASVAWIRGRLDEVGGYAYEVFGTETHATSFSDSSVPEPGAGYFYLVRLAGDRGSWQTTPGAQPARDAGLP